MAIIGYARVSTDGQSLDAQESALRGAGAVRVLSEKASGAATERKALARALAALGRGDLLIVTRLDRLARSTRDLLNVLAQKQTTLDRKRTTRGVPLQKRETVLSSFSN
jgi:DNA invertase Pin-like site-specific DNA recombinase